MSQPADPPTLPRPAPRAASGRPISASLVSLWAELPLWMRVAALALVLYTGVALTPLGAALDGSAYELVFDAARLGIEGGAFLWAAARTELPRRLVLALRLTGWASLGTAVFNALLVPERLGLGDLLSEPVESLLTLAGYAAALAALLVYPRTPPAPGQRLPLVIDSAVTAGSLGLLGWTLITSPSQVLADSGAANRSIQVFGLAQLALIVGLNVVVVRGLATPTARAFWAFVAGQALYVPVTALVQLHEAGLVSARPVDLFYYAGVLPTLAACHWMRSDPFVRSAFGGRPAWLRDLNPIPLTMPIWLGAALLPSIAAGATARALVLGVALTVVSLLLGGRLLLSARRAAALARADAQHEHQRQVERLEAVGRLAGGIAHEFNNRLARIVGHADLGEWEGTATADVREHFRAVRTAALGAAELTQQLLAFSGRQRLELGRVEADVVVDAAVAEVLRERGRGIRAELRGEGGPFVITADPTHLRAAVTQLVENAVEAMPDGGTLAVTVGTTDLHEPLAAAHLQAPAGRYVAIALRDTGVGIAPEALGIVCDPFYSTKADHLGAGLGLASVHGFVASHAGGLTVTSVVGEGTTVTMYLPTI